LTEHISLCHPLKYCDWSRVKDFLPPGPIMKFDLFLSSKLVDRAAATAGCGCKLGETLMPPGD
jgi:hypothetical protein